jgi:hypothetical protein
MYDRGAVPHNLRANAPAGMGEPQTRRRVLRLEASARSLKCEAHGVKVKEAKNALCAYYSQVAMDCAMGTIGT